MEQPQLVTWRTRLVAHALYPEHGTSVPVAVGLVDTSSDGVQIGLQVSDHDPLFLPLHGATQLANNLIDTTTACLTITAEALGGGDQS